MIDKKTGFIDLNLDNIIKPTMSLGEIKSLVIGESHDERALGNGWIWYNVKNVKVADQYFIIFFGFYDDKLNQLSLVFNDSKYDLSNSWKSRSEKEERQNAFIFNNWLKAELGSERVFAWGEVWADYDDKGGSSSIGIRYKN